MAMERTWGYSISSMVEVNTERDEAKLTMVSTSGCFAMAFSTDWYTGNRVSEVPQYLSIVSMCTIYRQYIHLAHELASKGIDDTCNGRLATLADEVKV
jgi:hypothetical protein